ncbi:hypothetical protein XELAEV_18047856mg [Xenopus laevis]|uniref:EF-hand domain-containing protein n=1 Tax=Xenopus laevis TaxID=8355 RepID=A0A974BWA2_XENLA|nr:hypothetical protein XELAEV_18047856mg [Xenopus laevis]
MFDQTQIQEFKEVSALWECGYFSDTELRRVTYDTHYYRYRITYDTHYYRCRVTYETHYYRCRVTYDTHYYRCRVTYDTHYYRCRVTYDTHYYRCRAFTVIDQNRDGIIDKEDLRDTFAAMGRVNVKNEELEEMVKEASGPINFTVFLTMFGEKLKGADPEDVITGAFKVLDPEAKGSIKKQFLEELLTTQCDRFTPDEIKNMWTAFPPDVAGNVDYKNICYVITHGEDKDQE